MVELVKYEDRYYEALSTYHLDKSQSVFTAGFNFCINERKDLEDPDKTVVTILYNKTPVGFFVLDIGKDKFKLTDNPNAILIRSLSVNPSYQGKGIGKLSMTLVKDVIRINMPDIDKIILAVNFRNKNAYHTYLKAGFTDENKVNMGRKGPQHILNLNLY